MSALAAPPWTIAQWFNTEASLTLTDLRGRVILLHAFQMLCPGCVAHGLPQAQRVTAAFRDRPLVVLGLHTVFEHHEAMSPTSLRAFLHEYRVGFPVGVDTADPSGRSVPLTMRAYDMQGTPTTVLIDAEGRRRHQLFGIIDDLSLGAMLQTLLLEAEGMPAQRPAEPSRADAADTGCDVSGCRP